MGEDTGTEGVAKALKRRAGAVLGNPRMLEPLARLSRRGYVPRSFWGRWPVRGDFYISLPGGGRVRFVGAENEYADRIYFWRGIGGYEPETCEVFCKLAGEAEAVLDAGANTGLYTLLACAASPRVRVVAFEPSPHAYGRLRASVTANGWGDRCSLHREAVSDQAGVADFCMVPGRSHKSGMPDGTALHHEEGRLVQVPVTTLDAACAGEGRVDLVKLDVEGYEDRALRGMSGLIEEHAPDIIVECVHVGPFREVEGILKRHGYKLHHLTAAGPVPRETIVPDRGMRERNYLATRRPSTLELLSLS